DDVILKIVTKPLYYLVVSIGLYFALKTLSIISLYTIEIDQLFFVGIVFIVSYIISKILSIFISDHLKVQKKFEKTPQLITKIISIIVYLVAIVIVLEYFNVEITPLVAGLGVGGLAIGLALQSTLSNFFAGVHIITDKPIKVGDFIEIEGSISGFVEDIGWRSTRIRTLPNTLVIVPNSKLAESVIINNSLPVLEMSVKLTCGVAYDSDLDKVEKVTIDVAKKVLKTVPGAIKDFKPFIRFNNFGDSNIDFSIILRVEKPTAKYLVTHEFIKALKKRYDKEGIEISWPVRKIYYGDKPKK
ncbi:MAG: mechanosensitive ion channel family protein, partial [Candidatus Aenigmarchaeota archaeon]|nr:mechanosensitive ion channel family protein [Candidatus Aenigmarchaeota archaeon]